VTSDGFVLKSFVETKALIGLVRHFFERFFSAISGLPPISPQERLPTWRLLQRTYFCRALPPQFDFSD
jgi:hypothetical protein